MNNEISDFIKFVSLFTDKIKVNNKPCIPFYDVKSGEQKLYVGSPSHVNMIRNELQSVIKENEPWHQGKSVSITKANGEYKFAVQEIKL